VQPLGGKDMHFDQRALRARSERKERLIVQLEVRLEDAKANATEDELAPERARRPRPSSNPSSPSGRSVTNTFDSLPSDLVAAHALILAERTARLSSEERTAQAPSARIERCRVDRAVEAGN
jgi:hypothetical protein